MIWQKNTGGSLTIKVVSFKPVSCLKIMSILPDDKKKMHCPLKTCYKDIWKTIIASSFKLGQLTEDEE